MQCALFRVPSRITLREVIPTALARQTRCPSSRLAMSKRDDRIHNCISVRSPPRCKVSVANSCCTPSNGQARTYRTTSRTRQDFSRVGAEPGIDSTDHGTGSDRHSRYSNTESTIKVVDYSDKRVTESDVDPAQLQSFLAESGKPSWAACRWIHVNGLNLDVVKRLGFSKNLHRLAIEDVLDTRTPTKVDWYEDHCFMVMTLQKLVRFSDHQNVAAEGNSENPLWYTLHDARNSRHQSHHDRQLRWRTLAHEKLGMSVEQVSMFLTADNTVITIFEHSGHEVLMPIMERLNSSQSVVRTSKDPSMLVQAVIDAVVDLSIPIAKAAGETFGELELAVLMSPSISQSKHLYILRSGLTSLMENMISTGGLVRTLCDHHSDAASPAKHTAASNEGTTSDNLPDQVQISPLTRVYLQDVQDHITALFTSTRESIRAAENLTSLIFNTIAASQNESVRKLTLLSSFFLPLTFLTGYFGMNFDPMPVVNNNSDVFFWWIATPVMVVAVLFLGPKPSWLRSLAWRRRRQLKYASPQSKSG